MYGKNLRGTCGSHIRRLDINEDGGYRLAEETYLYPYVGYKQCVVREENDIKNFGVCSGSIKGETVTLVKDPKVEGGGSKNGITGKGCVPELLGKVWFDTKADANLKKDGELDDGQIVRKE